MSCNPVQTRPQGSSSLDAINLHSAPFEVSVVVDRTGTLRTSPFRVAVVIANRARTLQTRPLRVAMVVVDRTGTLQASLFIVAVVVIDRTDPLQKAAAAAASVAVVVVVYRAGTLQVFPLRMAIVVVGQTGTLRASFSLQSPAASRSTLRTAVDLPRRRTYASSFTKPAGVTPSIRRAWAIDSGRVAASAVRSAMLSPPTAA